MQKIFKSVLSFCLAVAVCLGTATFLGMSQYKVADAATVDEYYSKITASGGTQLLGQLHDLIVETHKTYTSYDDCKKYGPTTDPGLDGKGVMEFYTHETIMKFVGGVGDWNREHVWCQSLSNGLWGTGGGGSDLHHIRPSESGLNSTRGNNKYGYAKDSGKEAWSRDNNKNNSKLGGWYIGNSIFEPLDNVKGDAARIVMYVYTHYNNASNVNGTKESAKTHGNLNFTNVISASNEAAAIKLLLEWNKLDPVDEIELYRNEAVYKIQGNRNPFIDNSSYAEAIWGGGTVVDPGPNPGPSDTLKSIRLSATSLNLAIGETYNLTVTPNPSNASASVIWSTSDSSVVTVSNGQIVANSAGTATITATSTTNTSIKATATVTVRQTSSSTTTSGKATITRDSFTNASGGYAFQTWKTKNNVEGIAFIYSGKEESMQFNNKQKSYYLASTTTVGTIKSITVKASDDNTEDRPWKLLTSTTAYGTLDGSNPKNGNDRGTKTVTESGVTWNISGNDTHFALVYALEGEQRAAYLESVVVEYGTGSSENTGEIEELFINPSAFELEEGESTKLTVSVIPSTASAAVSWTSSNPSVATVSADGTVTAVKAGTATITATSTTNSAITATSTVTVTAEQFVSGSSNATAFHNAVAAIDSHGRHDEWRTTINVAVNAYKKLSASDKAEVAADVEKLKSEIANYNAIVKAYNEAADDADEPALNGVGTFL